ncbi:serine/threonine-protein kinase atg1-like isoform X2 [Bradysia coprophila]|uniref:serine/threonine-protein kinase atg1-like isoform X2 n=1 Tax=Bradysia coprophila TaxID=38358 RepID=UPI00187DBBF5|nr:serine/threonine-protein kinase atg1-like isoform X2 [Bradysia coprophila]
MSQSSRLLEDFKLRSFLGVGAFGAVIKCQKLLESKEYAIKVTSGDALQEVQTLVSIPPHKNLVQYITCWNDRFSKADIQEVKKIVGTNNQAIDCFSDPTKIRLCIQMELCGESLRTWLLTHQSVDEKKTIGLFMQMVAGIEHIHKSDIIHRDLKPENIFMGIDTDSLLKIGDFGIATEHKLNQSAVHTQNVGSPAYLAPEQHTGRYSKAVDLYALGVILYELLYPAMQPAPCAKWSQMITDLKQNKTIIHSVKNRWPTTTDLILQLTSFHPRDRPSFNEIYRTFVVPSSSKRQPSGSSQNSSGSNRLSSGHQASSITTKPTVIHKGITCDGCGKENIEGIRYKCTECEEYNLCESCETRTGLHPQSHIFNKIKVPGSYKNLNSLFADMNKLSLTNTPKPSYQNNTQPTPPYQNNPQPTPPYQNYHQPTPPHQNYPQPTPPHQNYPQLTPLLQLTPPYQSYPQPTPPYQDFLQLTTPSQNYHQPTSSYSQPSTWCLTQQDEDDDDQDDYDDGDDDEDYEYSSYSRGAVCNYCDKHVQKWYQCKDCPRTIEGYFDYCSHCYHKTSGSRYDHTRYHRFRKYRC